MNGSKLLQFNLDIDPEKNYYNAYLFDYKDIANSQKNMTKKTLKSLQKVLNKVYEGKNHFKPGSPKTKQEVFHWSEKRIINPPSTPPKKKVWKKQLTTDKIIEN